MKATAKSDGDSMINKNEKTRYKLLCTGFLILPNLVGATRFELATPTMSRWCSNQLSYAPANP
jgi:hypothetical protein